MFHFHKYKDPNCKVRHPIPYRRTELCSIWYDMGVLMMMMMMNFLLPPQGEEVSFSSRTDEKSSRLLLPVRVRRSRRRFPLFLVALDEEKIAVKKSPLHEVLLIHDAVPRFFGRRHLRQLSRRLTVRGWRRLRFSLFFSLFLLLFFPSPQPVAARPRLGLKLWYCSIAGGPHIGLLAGRYVPFGIEIAYLIEYDVDEDEKILVGKEFQTTLSYVVELVPKLWLPVRFIEGRLCREVKTNLLCVREEAQRIQRLKGEMLDICSVNLEHKHDEVQINYIKK
ncbi:hypothetical protein B296_00002225, partial [Ensete ventricosum]